MDSCAIYHFKIMAWVQSLSFIHYFLLLLLLFIDFFITYQPCGTVPEGKKHFSF